MSRLHPHLASIPGLPRRIGLDLRGERLRFVEAVLTPWGPRFNQSGCKRPREGESVDAMLTRLGSSRWLKNAEVVLGIRHPELKTQRILLPPITMRDAKSVARRRSVELGQGETDATCSGFAIVAGKAERPAWIFSCPESFIRFSHERWTKRGIPVTRFVPISHALASLTRHFAKTKPGELRAFLDLSDGFTVCVLSDGDGWVFSRELSIKVTGDPSSEHDGIDTAERLAAELRRTFHYVASELRTGEVNELWLSGEASDLEQLGHHLSAALSLPTHCFSEWAVDGTAKPIDSANACAFGLATAPGQATLELLPVEARREVATRTARRRLARSAIAVAVATGTAACHLGAANARLERQAEDLAGRWNALEPKRAELEAIARTRELSSELTALRRDIVEVQPPWTAALEALGKLLPADAVLERVTGTSDDGWSARFEIEFRGSSVSEATAAADEFGKTLDGSPLFRVRQTRRSAGSRVSGDDRTRVRVEIESEIAHIKPKNPRASEASRHG